MKPFSYLLILCGFIYVNTQAQISRSQIIANAEPYQTLQWTASSANIWNNVQCGGKNILSPTWLSMGTNYSMPYCWGGNSSTSGFLTGISNGRSAGDICASSCGYSFGAEPNCSVGVDCSGFVCRAWGRTDHVSTSQLHTISTQLSSFSDMQIGDIVNHAGSHTRLVHTLNANGTWEMIESSGSYDKVHYRTYSYSDLSTNYLPRIYDNIIGGGGSQQQQAGSSCNTATTITQGMGTNCSWTTSNISNATPSGFPKGSCDNVSGTPSLNDDWYKFVAQNNEVLVAVEPLNSGSTAIDPVIVLYSSCNSGSEIQCTDVSGGPGGIGALAYNNLVTGQTYYIRVYDYGTINATAGSYRICATYTQPDLVVQSLNTVPSTIYVGDNIDLCATIENLGPGDASTTITWEYKIDGSYIDDDTHSSLNSGDIRNECETNYVFNSPGTYQYCVVIQNHAQESNTSNNTSCTSITVLAPPCPGSLAVSISGTSSTCAGLSVSLTANATGCSGNCNYQWSGGFGSSSLISVSPTQTTTYTVTVTDGNNCTATASKTVTVNPIPNVTISPTNPTVCQGGSTTLTASGTGTFTWSNGGSSSQNTVNSAGTYSVTVTSNGCTATASATVTQSNLLSISINATPTSICSGGSASLIASGANTYSWSNGDTGPNITVNTSGTYSVTGTNSAGCTGTASTTIGQSNGPTVIVTASPANIQPGNSSVLSVSPSNGTNYQWSDGSINGSNPTVSPTANTTYSVTVTNASGCTGTGSVTVNVSNCQFSLTPPSILSYSAAGGTASAQLQATGPPPCDWISNSCSWVSLSPSNGTGNQTINLIITANTDTTSRTCTVTIGGESFTITQDGTSVNCTLPQPILNVASDGERLSASFHQGVTYLWLESSFAANGVNNTQYYNTLGDAGCYSVMITDINDPTCFRESDTVCLPIVGLNDLELETNISIYPNPSTGQYTISLSGEIPSGDFDIKVYNILGQLLTSTQHNALGSPIWQTEIDLSSQPVGVYLLEVSTKESGNAPVKLIKH